MKIVLAIFLFVESFFDLIGIVVNREEYGLDGCALAGFFTTVKILSGTLLIIL